MKNLLLLIALFLTSAVFAQDKLKNSFNYKYELNKEYVFSSGNIEIKVFLDEKGNANISRNKLKVATEKVSFVFFKKGDEIVFGYDNFNLKDSKLGEKYWLIPFDTEQEIIHMHQNSNVKAECICSMGYGACVMQQLTGGGTVRIGCFSEGCPQCELKLTPVNNVAGNYLMIRAESVKIDEK